MLEQAQSRVRRGHVAGGRRAGGRARDPRRRRQGPGLRPPRAPAASTRGPSASWSSPTRTASAGRTSRWPARSATRSPRRGAGRWRMNVSMPIAAVLLDLGFAAATVKAIPLLARTASLLAHLAEEQEQPVGFLMAAHAEEAITYEREPDLADRRRATAIRRLTMLDPAVETRPWDEQLALDDARVPRAARLPVGALQLLPARSSAPIGVEAAADAGGLADLPRLPLTEKQELRATTTPDEPVRHAPLRAAGRDRAHLLHERHDRHAELHPADGERPRELDRDVGAQLRGLGRARRPADRLDVQRRAVRGRRGARGVRPHRPLPPAVRHRQHRAADARGAPAAAARRPC